MAKIQSANLTLFGETEECNA